MQYLLLARHGNTFAPGQKVVWVGSSNDLPLVESGLAQAESLAQALEKAVIKPQAIYAATLKRAVNYAQIVQNKLRLTKDVILDTRLNEIDYGNWSGLSNEEIKAQFGDSELNEWSEHGKWSKAFNGLESDIEEEVKDFAKEIIEKQSDKKIILAVTSNGRLKYFLKLLPNIYADYVQRSKWKVATGNICLLGYEKRNWHLICWNASPQILDDLRITDRV